MEWMVSVLMVSVSLYSTGERANPITMNRKVFFKAAMISSMSRLLSAMMPDPVSNTRTVASIACGWSRSSLRAE